MRFRWPWRDESARLARTARPRCVLFTGAAGALGTAVLPSLTDSAENWRLVDARGALPGGFTDCHVRELGAADAHELFDGVDAVVHFAAQSIPAQPAILRYRNVDTVAWLLDSMQRSGIRRLVYASSMHVMGMYERTEVIGPDSTPRPDGPYGESKRRAEALIQGACASTDLSALILRIGHAEHNVEKAEPANWLAMADLVRLIDIGLNCEFAGAPVVHAVTPHRGDDMQQHAFAKTFGMTWSDAPSYRNAMKRVAQWYGNDAMARQYRGGVFASGRADAEFGVSRDAGLDA